jgi:N-acetylmuramoyl-L-alanine amidase
MRNKKYVWLFDPGHGGIVDGQYMTSGKRSPLWKDGTQYFEGVGNRQIVQKLIKKCDEHNIYNFDVVASEYDIALSERVKIANQYYKTLGNCIYVSIHSNGFSKESANGYSIYTSKGETKSDRIAEVFIDNMVKHFPTHKLRKDTRDGDKDKEAQFYVLRKTRCPAILIENFFMTNYRECKLLMNEEFQNRIVDCHFKSILQIEENGY